MPNDYNTLFAVLKGSVRVNNNETGTINAAEVGLFAQAGGHICINSAEEIRQVMADY